MEVVYIIGSSCGAAIFTIVMCVFILLVILIVLKKRRKKREIDLMHTSYAVIYDTIAPIGDTTYDTVKVNAKLEMSQNEAYLKLIKETDLKEEVSK